MRWIRSLLAATAVALALALVPAAAATATHSDLVFGLQTGFQGGANQVSSFDGLAFGDLPGRLHADVNHPPLATTTPITGGNLVLRNVLRGILIQGAIVGGLVERQTPDVGCPARERFGVSADANVTWLGVGPGHAHFLGTLTHLQTVILGGCVTYSATLTGGLDFDFGF